MERYCPVYCWNKNTIKCKDVDEIIKAIFELILYNTIYLYSCIQTNAHGKLLLIIILLANEIDVANKFVAENGNTERHHEFYKIMDEWTFGFKKIHLEADCQIYK
jgi:hypothetical protein